MMAIEPMPQARDRRHTLPLSCAPRGLSRTEAAAYVGIGATLFDRMVVDGRMPKPKKIDGRKVWDIRKLDAAFDKLPDVDGTVDEGAEERDPDDGDRWEPTL